MINQLADQKVSEVLNKYGAFFAFSDKQYDEKAVTGVEYVSVGMGLIAPKEHASTVVRDIREAYSTAAKEVKSTKSKKDRIWYELSNHECQITYDYSEAYSALEIYGDITLEDVKAEFPAYMRHCVENDLF